MENAKSFTGPPEWLEERLSRPGMAIVDGSWYLPAQKRDARAEYEAAHIPGAVFFDHDLIVEPNSGLPHALPNPELFAQFAGAMGIAVDDQIVVYDGPGLFSAARVWWMFRAMGAKHVFVLDGGFDRWKAAGRPVTAEPTKIAPCLFKVDFHADMLARLDDVKVAVARHDAQIVDARPAGRFSGAEPEPRPGVRDGHMPGALNLPAATLSADGKLLAPEQLRQAFEKAGVDLEQPVITSCGSGITAGILSLALETIGHKANRLYDGSWAEWATQADTQAVVEGNSKA